MKCPNCKTTKESNLYRCSDCNYGLVTRAKPKPTKARYLGDDGHETRDEELGRTLHCSNCGSRGGSTERMLLDRAGFSRHVEFIVVTCEFCGIVQMYNPDIVDGVSSGWPRSN